MLSTSRHGLLAASVLALTLLSSPHSLYAQAPTPEAIGRADVAAKPSTDELTWALSAGSTINTGNTQAWLVNAGSRFRLSRGIHAVTSEFLFNVGRANVKTSTTDATGATIEQQSWATTAQNINAKVRYELFLTDLDALFLGEIFRWDHFAGLDSRFQTQIGYQRHFIRVEKHRFWSEAGYDLTLDNYNPDSIVPNTETVHAARLMLGYNNELNENVLLLTELEGLFNVEELEDVRINYTLGLRSTLSESLKAELSFTARFDNVPVPGAMKLDTLTQVSLIYALM